MRNTAVRARWALLILLPALLGPPCAAGDVPVDGLADIDRSRDPLRPGTEEYWLAVAASRPVPVFRGPIGDERRPVELAFGEVLYVLKESKESGRRRLALARYAPKQPAGVVWQSDVGWVDDAWCLEDEAPLDLKAARDRATLTGLAMPGVEAIAVTQNANVPLKVVTAPDLDQCQSYPGLKSADTYPLMPFCPYYAYRIHGDYVLLGAVGQLRFGTGARGLLGWVPVSRTVPWFSREGVELNVEEGAVQLRRQAHMPARLFRIDERGGLERRNPIWQEPIENPAWQPKCWPDDYQRWAILGSSPDGDTLQVAYLGQVKDDQKLPEPSTRRLDSELRAFERLEIVLVIDCTPSMEPVKDALCRAVENTVRGFVRAARGEIPAGDETESVVRSLKVAVVGYADFPAGDVSKPEAILQCSSGYFDVGTQGGLEGLRTFIRNLRIGVANDDRLEQPLEGVNRSLDLEHSPGAGQAVIVIGNAGQKAKGVDGRFDQADLRRWLSTRFGQAASAKQKEAVIPLYSIFTPTEEPGADRTIAGYSEWRDQLEWLASETGGTAELVTLGRSEQLSNTLTGCLWRALEKHLGRVELIKHLGLEYSATHDGAVRGAPVLVDAKDEVIRRIIEQTRSGQQSEVLGGVHGLFFSRGYIDNSPVPGGAGGDPCRRPYSLRILMTRGEMRDLQSACAKISASLKAAMAQPGLAEARAERQREVVVQALFAGYGIGKDAARYREAMDTMTFSEIQRTYSHLPVRLRILEAADRDFANSPYETLRDLRRRLQEVEDALNRAHEAGERWFYLVPGRPRDHIWLNVNELP